jgi:hypothetical protein
MTPSTAACEQIAEVPSVALQYSPVDPFKTFDFALDMRLLMRDDQTEVVVELRCADIDKCSCHLDRRSDRLAFADTSLGGMRRRCLDRISNDGSSLPELRKLDAAEKVKVVRRSRVSSGRSEDLPRLRLQFRRMTHSGRFLPNATAIFDELFRLLLAQKQSSILKSRKSWYRRMLTSV